MNTAASLERFEPVTDLPLDIGIRKYVLALRSQGVETFESCQGGQGHSFPEPTVRFHGGIGAGFKAYGTARELGLPVSSVRLYYNVLDGVLHGPWWEMVFSTADRG